MKNFILILSVFYSYAPVSRLLSEDQVKEVRRQQEEFVQKETSLRDCVLLEEKSIRKLLENEAKEKKHFEGIKERQKLLDFRLKENLVAHVAQWQLAKSRSGNHEIRTRSMVSVPNKKYWAQKETYKKRSL